MSDPICLSVNIAGNHPCYSSISEALSAVSEWDADAPAQDKVFPAPLTNVPPVVIRIGPGVYREKLVITRPGVTLLGTDSQKTVLVYGQGAYDPMPDGAKRGTFRTASFRVDAPDFTARHLTFQNDAGPGCEAGQAIAFYADGDRLLLEDCRLIGSQDTLFLAPLPEKEFQPGGFRGPGEHKPRTMCRSLFRNCYIQGDIDFIFGSGIAYFDRCTIFSALPGRTSESAEKSGDTACLGYVTAASTPKDAPYGFVFRDCRLVSDCPPASVYLGRPWREFARTVFINCELGSHIHPRGWHDWGKTHGNFFYAEYRCTGQGQAPAPANEAGEDCPPDLSRADFSRQLTPEEANSYTVQNVLQGWVPEDSSSS